MSHHTQSLTLRPDNARRLSSLCGRLNEHIHQIETFLAMKIQQRGNVFQLTGSATAVADARNLLESLYLATDNGGLLDPSLIHLALQEVRNGHAHAERQQGNARSKVRDGAYNNAQNNAQNSTQNSAQNNKQERRQQGATDTDDTTPPPQVTLLKTPRLSIKPRSKQQQLYVADILRKDISFGIGPAGTGKTYLAVACAVQALVSNEVSRLILVRPAVEAGEKLGFLPGDLTQKIDPYLRPLYDALYEMLGFEKVTRLIDKNVIEVAPLAYMRGRTLNNSFIILDEGQNTTTAQMKMFLTRMGFGSTGVITGDVTQVDLPRGERSGLVHVANVLKNLPEIGFTWFTSKDVVRHTLVQRIVDAYDEFDRRSDSSPDDAQNI
ncbi:MAG: PhoH family protein [Pseudohongiellaceae bacterium]